MTGKSVPYAASTFGILPKIECHPEQERKLMAIIGEAKGKGIDFDILAIPPDLDDLMKGCKVVAEEAVRWLLHRKVYSSRADELRAMTKAEAGAPVRTTMEQLRDILPGTDTFPPWPQLRAEMLEGDPFSEGPELVGDGDASKKDDWDRRLHPGVLKKTLSDLLELMDRLAAKAEGTKPPEVPERRFVEHLAHHWTVQLGLPIKNNGGRFGKFVKQVLLLVPADLWTHLRFGSFDGHIRQVIDKFDDKSGPKIVVE
jgi:hypothetical protein